MNKKSTRFNDTVLQKLVIATFIISMVASIASQVYFALIQYPHNQNFSSFLMPLMWLVLPFIYLTVAYLTHTGKTKRVTRFFDALVLTASVIVLQGTVAMVLQPLYQFLPLNNGNILSYVLYESIQFLLLLAVMVVVLLKLRRSKRW